MKRMVLICVCTAFMVSCGTQKALMRQNVSLDETVSLQKREMDAMQGRIAAVENEMKAVVLDMRSREDRDSASVTFRMEEEYDAFARPDNPPLSRRVIEVRGVRTSSVATDSATAVAGSVMGSAATVETVRSTVADSTSVTDTAGVMETEGKASNGPGWWRGVLLCIGAGCCICVFMRVVISVFNMRSNGILTTIKKILNNG